MILVAILLSLAGLVFALRGIEEAREQYRLGSDRTLARLELLAMVALAVFFAVLAVVCTVNFLTMGD